MPKTAVGDASASAPCTRLESRSEWRVDTIVHVAGVTFGLAACVTLAIVALPDAASDVLISLAVYAAGLLATLSCSALCNIAGHGPLKALLRRLDHAAIFVMIASTYTPFAVIAIGGSWGIGLLAFVWSVAAAGVALKLLRPEGIEALSTAAYLLLGWTILVAIDRLIAAVSLPALLLLASGGMTLQRRRPLLPLAPTTLPQGHLARLRADGSRVPVLRHPGRHQPLRETGGSAPPLANP